MTAEPRTTKQGTSAQSPVAPHRGEMATLVYGKDWSQTPLGPMDQWPQSLRTVVNIVLTSRYAMWMAWGPDLIFLCNDAYRPTLGIKHPWALGNPANVVWAEIWKDIGPLVDVVLETGEATYYEGLMLILERSGFREETYHTFSYSPLTDDDGRINGMLCVVTEETERFISQRRLSTLRDLATGLAATNTEAEVLAAVERDLGTNTKDFPFTLTYLYDMSGSAQLACATGVETGSAIAPLCIEKGFDVPWPAAANWAHPASHLVEDLSEWQRGAQLPHGAWDRPAHQIGVVPIRHQASERPAGFLICGINPYRRYDEGTAGFLELVAGQIAAGISSSRAYEEERRRAESLAELDRAKTAFFSNVSHEFRTPLTLMLGPVEDMLAKPPEQLLSANRELLEVVQRSGFRLQRLVNTLLDFSRIEAGRAQASYEPTDLTRLTTELASSFRSAMDRAGLAFTVDCDSLSRPVYVDREMWEKIVLNLVSNAFKYTLHGTVSVRLSEEGNNVKLSVKDTGLGIPEQDLTRLFERFYRVEGATGRTHEGTGIGLALVQELVKLHGGTVSVKSTHGQGSEFIVSLPLGSAHLPQDRLGTQRSLSSTALHTDVYVDEAMRWLPAAEQPQAAELPAVTSDRVANEAGARSLVLLADDNADMRDYVTRLLSTRYEVIAVPNGLEALHSAMSRVPDLVLSDVMMPLLDGFGLLRALRESERTKTIPILLLSARAGEESRVEGLNAGADDYLVKPFTARELLARVEAHLSLTRMRKLADQARRLSEVRLGLALESSQMMAWEWDPASDRFVSIGDQRGMFGTTFPSFTEGLNVVHPDDQAARRTIVAEVKQEGGSWHAEFRVIRPDSGDVAWLEERATALYDDSGQVERIVGVVVDVTSRKLAENELQSRNEELIRANQELEEFAYVASHDLQEPLRMVNIYTQMLLRRGNFAHDEQSARYADFVQKGVRQMETLIKDLLQYSRVVHPEQDIPRAADLNVALDQALSVLRVSIDESNASVEFETLPEVWGEERQLALVFQNLVSNAIKYRQPDVAPVIKIRAQVTDGECCVIVRDNGIGFRQDYATQIFGLFKRLHKDAYPGTGLGLAISKRIVERYGGRIWAESKGENQGAEFKFCLRPSR